MKPLDYQRQIPEVLQAFIKAQAAISSGDLSPTLVELIKIRASQINGCAFCLDMHLRDARKQGESSERLDRIIVWRQVHDFTPAEQAVLSWTETLTTIDPKTDYATERAKLEAHFEEKEIALITTSIAMINLWNRMQVHNHA
ncbi:MAG: alkylhydroperoxidase [Armatimonadetes bacterium 55-13]|nr:carboxymuconolactone decarboxylase family protein [Armatimonadota bacterium]OJU64193.1 MAG: alkylhydroperoxidase [Armatimonadetes bacterium 55-13]